jgi:hypothetical protein
MDIDFLIYYQNYTIKFKAGSIYLNTLAPTIVPTGKALSAPLAGRTLEKSLGTLQLLNTCKLG